MEQSQKIGVFALAMLIAGSIDSIRNLPATAMFGTTLIFFFILSAIVFLIPASLVSAELSSAWPEQSGVYAWVSRGLGKKLGFLAIWLQWINTMVWFPTILSFIAGTAAYLIDPNLANEKWYLVAVILSVFWLLTILNLKGVKVSANFASIAAVFGMIIPMALIIVLAAIWIYLGKPIQIQLNAHNLLPSMHHSQNWISLTAIMTAFLGMELATVHVKDVKNAQKTFPLALLIATIIILTTMILGSLAIAVVLPLNKINLVDGILQAFNAFLQAYHMAWFESVMVIMILVGSLGSMINWIISPARGLLQASEHGFFTRDI